MDPAVEATPDPLPRTRIRPPWYWGSLSGLLAGFLAVGIGLLTAQWFSVSTPTDAVASAFIDRVPKWLKTLAIDWFGTNDKVALRVGIYVVIGLLAVLIGWRSLHARWTGVSGFVAFGLLGMLCVLDRPRASFAAVMPVALATLSGITALLAMFAALDRQWRATHFPQRSRVPLGLDRRGFLAVGGSVALAGIGTTVAGSALENNRVRRLRASAPAALPPLAESGTPASVSTTIDSNSAAAEVEAETPFITPSDKFYRIDTAVSFPNVSADNWKLRIHGLVNRELTLSYADVLARPQIERTVTLACVSNEVGGDLVGTASWQGIPLAAVLNEAGVQSSAQQVFCTSADGWTCGFPVEAVFDGREPMLVIGMNGEPLPIQHGFPARLVVPGLYGYVSATKWLTDIHLTTWDDEAGYWTTRGWSVEAPIKAQSRIDVPRRGADLQAGTIVLGGVAWAHRHGVDRVEVRIDEGPWVAATLDSRGDLDTWRQWFYVWDAIAGKHRVTVRTVDGSGAVQTDEIQSPDPDGATGHHSRRFTIR